MKRRVSWLLAALLAVLALAVLSREPMAQGALANLPRNETLILENPEGTDQERRMVQHLGHQRGQPVERAAAGGPRYALVHRPQSRA